MKEMHTGTHSCMTADKLQQGRATPLLYENVNTSRLGNSDRHARDAWAGFWDFSLPDSCHPPPHPFTHTHRLTGKMVRSAKLIVAGKEVAAVSVSCVFPRLLTDTKQTSFRSLWGWLRKTTPRYEALLKGYIKPRVTTVQRDHINRWTDSRLRLPADVFHILEYLKEHKKEKR